MTTQTTTAGSAGLLWPAIVEAPSSGWAVPISGDVGTLPWGRLRRVIEYIQQNLDQALTLAELAALLYMSPYHFARLFKCSTGVPPHRFVIRQRITRACAILARRSCPSRRSRGWWDSGPRVTSPQCSAASRVSRPRDIEPGL